MNEQVFLDASFWIAFRDKRESQHNLARAVLSELARRRIVLVTTLLVAAETHAYFSRSNLRQLILQDIENTRVIRMETLSADDQSAGFAVLRQYQDKEFSLCDAMSFALIERLKIRRALSFDDHFRQFGKVRLIIDPEEV